MTTISEAPPNPAWYQYYSTQRPIDLGTFPKPTDNEPVQLVFYDERIPVEHGAFLAWGELFYEKPLTPKQMDDYELKPSPKNWDIKERIHTQTQRVGKWEQQKHIQEAKRLTWWYSDFGSFVLKEFVTPEQLATRHEMVTERLAAQKKVPKGKQTHKNR